MFAEGDGVRHPETGATTASARSSARARSCPRSRTSSIGHKTGDELHVDASSRPNFRVPALGRQGRARVDIKVVRVQEPHLPEIDEAFAASFGIKEGGISKFREDVRANLERELKGVLMARLKASHGRKAGRCVSRDRAAAVDDRKRRARAGPPGHAPGDDAFVAYLPAARKRVAAGFLLAELGRQNEVRLDSRRVSEALAMIASTYEEPEKVIELYTRDPQLMSGLQSRVIEDQVVEWVAEHAKLTEQQLSFNEVMRPGA